MKFQLVKIIIRVAAPLLVVFLVAGFAMLTLVGSAANAAFQANSAVESGEFTGNVVVGTCAPKCPGVNGPQTGLSVKQAIAQATSEIGQCFPTGFNMPGECIKSTQRWINSAGGNFPPGGFVAGYEAAPATRVTDGSLRPGDIIQFERIDAPDLFGFGVHTYMVLAVNDDGTHDIIESNWNWDGCVGVRLNQNFAPPPGFRAAVWRFASEPDT